MFLLTFLFVPLVVALTIPSLSLPDSELVNGMYIITLDRSISVLDFAKHIQWAEKILDLSPDDDNSTTQGIEKTWSNSFQGYSGTFNPKTIERISANSQVSSGKRSTQQNTCSTYKSNMPL